MASKGREVKTATQTNVISVGRFVYDVLMYTLPKCGLPETRLPTTDVKDNVYKRPDLVRIAGVSALRVALIMRDKWKRMFESRRKTSGLDDATIPTFMMNIMRCCPLSRKSTMQTMVEVILALSNEITLFFYSENIDFNATTVIVSVGFIIMNLIGSEKNCIEMLEGLFDKFENISKYTRWITDFIYEYADPYGARDVSDLFFQEVKKQHLNDIKRVKTETRDEPEDPAIKELKDRLGFLPHDLFLAIVAEQNQPLPDNLMASGSRLPGDRDSLESEKFPPPFEKTAIEKRKSRSRRLSRSGKTSGESELPESASVAVLPIQPPRSQEGSESGGIEKQYKRRPSGSKIPSRESIPVPKMASASVAVLPVEPPRAQEGSESSGVEKQYKRWSSGSKIPSRESIPLPKMASASVAVLPVEPPRAQEGSESGGIAKKKSSRGETARSREEASQQTTEIQSRRLESSEVRIEDELGQMSLGAESVSRKSRGAIPKKRDPEK